MSRGYPALIEPPSSEHLLLVVKARRRMVEGEEIDLPNKAHPEYDHLRQPELLSEDLRYTWAGGSASRAKAPEAAYKSAVSNSRKGNFPGTRRQGMRHVLVRGEGRERAPEQSDLYTAAASEPAIQP